MMVLDSGLFFGPPCIRLLYAYLLIKS